MSTAQKHFTSTKPRSNGDAARSKEELRRDRITAAVTLFVLALLMALVIWLASFGNSSVEGIDYWPMMP